MSLWGNVILPALVEFVKDLGHRNDCHRVSLSFHKVTQGKYKTICKNLINSPFHKGKKIGLLNKKNGIALCDAVLQFYVKSTTKFPPFPDSLQKADCRFVYPLL